jgi:hypothetical protein
MLNLPTSIGMSIFRADASDYPAQLQRREMPDGLKALIRQLFERGAITQCAVSYGSRMELRLAQRDRAGHTLLIGAKLEHFGHIFAEITGQQVAATWQASSSGSPGRSSDRDYSPMVGTLVRVVDAVADGIQLAAAIKILSDG